MSFVLEQSKHGRDTILYKNHKFREAYSLKNGDVVWRCLGKVCKATVKTDKEKAAIYFSSDTHTGAHPVTMRAMTPSPQVRSQGRSITTPTVEETPPVAATTSTPAPASVQKTISSPVSTKPKPSPDLLSENTVLKDEVARLRTELQVVLNHSIESDQRLLEFTDNVFLPPRSLLSNAVCNPSPTASRKDEDLERALAKVKALEEEVKILRLPCEQCSILKEESRNMINSIRCLEEENKLLKNTIDAKHKNSTINLSSPPLELRNSYAVLRDEFVQDENEAHFTPVTKKRNIPHKKKTLIKHLRQKNIMQNGKSDFGKGKTTAFKSVTIIGDSHVRGLAALVKNQLKGQTAVSGICKPGARMQDIKPTSSPPSDHCYVVMAGANDVGVGSESTIIAHLKELLYDCVKNSSVILVPIPTRYDLRPNSHVHDTVTLVNGCMAELSSRHQGVELLDTSTIRRHHHTTHGLHLNKSGKHLLANLVLKRLSSMRLPAHPSNTVARRVVPKPANTTSVPVPRILPHDTYAEAVIQSSRRSSANVENYNSSSKFFLESPLQATVLN